MRFHARLLLAAAIARPLIPCAFGESLQLRENLGKAWSNECVSFALDARQLAEARAGRALVDGDGRVQPCQVVQTGGVAALWVQVNLAPYETRAYRFAEAPAVQKTDLEVVETADALRIGNGRIGIELRKTLRPGEGPLRRFRMGSRVWTGGSAYEGKTAPARYELEVVARGPVFGEAVCRAAFADGGHWSLRFRVESGEPVVRVDESFDAPGGGTWQVVLGDEAFRPTHLLSRDSRVENAEVRSDPLGNFLLEPWLHWNNPRQGNWLALFTPAPASPDTAQETAADLLVVGALCPSAWVEPQWKGRAAQAAPRVQAKVREGLMTLDLPVTGGRRVWLLGALDQGESAAILLAKRRRVAPPAQRLVVKHGDFPLERVKDLVLDWPADKETHPCLFIRASDLPALTSRLPSDPRELSRWTRQQPIDKYTLDGPIREYVASGDAQLAAAMAAKAEEYLQTCVDWYLEQDYLHGPGTAPHMQSLIITTLNLLDPVLNSEAFSAEARQRVRAKLAFLGYVVSSPDYWSPERGFTGFANMTSVVALYRTALGCMLPSHPRAREWAELGLAQLRWQLNAWSDEDGGWLEAPHYAMVSFDHMLAGFTMAANAGYSESLYDPRMRKVIEWFAAISTPPDSRTGGIRHHPPIGNTYHGEPTGLYGLAAALWKDRDPDFAGRMQGMFERSGSFPSLGIGWNFPAMVGYRFLLSQSGVKPAPPDFGSAWFRRTGVVLRTTMATDRETYLHLIAGSNHDHYDFDSGSIVIYGKGRVLADDWGYIGRHPDRWHSMLTSAAAGGGGIMKIDAFATAAALDYVSGRKNAWQRQIGFAKDPDPRGPAFFLLRDTHEAEAPATWRLWLTAAEVNIHDGGATAIGLEDVDLDIFLFEPETLKLTQETATQNVTCAYRDGKEGPQAITQTAIVASVPGRGSVAALLHPRMKHEPIPKVTWSAKGHIVHVTSAAGLDTVFLAPTDGEHLSADGAMAFRGTAGAVQVRDRAVTLSLGAAGTVRAAGKELTAASSASRSETR